MSKRTCSVADCTNNHYGLGFCAKHHYRFKTHGDPHKAEYVRGGDPLERFESHTKRMPNGCIEWQATRGTDGYGAFSYQSRMVKAPRWLWQRLMGPIPDGHVIRHKCDNPPCVNIDHLETGTRLDNGNDMVVRGRSLIGEKHPRSRLTQADVLAIREALATEAITYRQLGARYGVSHTMIRHIESGRRWGHLLNAG